MHALTMFVGVLMRRSTRRGGCFGLLACAGLVAGGTAFARTALPLNDSWSGTVIDEEGRTNSLARIDLPHNWDDYHGCRQVPHGDRHGVATYRRVFTAEPGAGERSYLVFDGAGTYLTVRLNGRELCRRRLAGRLVTTLEATAAIRRGRNELEVECAHPSDIMDSPWQCCGCGNRTCESPEPFGLFRRVRLETTGGARIVPWGLHVWHDGECRTGYVEAELDFGSLAREGLTLRLASPELGFERRIACADAADGRIRAEFPLAHAERWSPENPKLYVFTAEILDASGRTVDAETARTGFRSIRWPLAGGDDHRFFLNGSPLFLHGTAETDHRQGASHAFEDEEIDARCAEFAKLGFNLVRSGHEPHDHRYLRRLEEAGILCWSDFSTRQYAESEAFRSNFLAAVEQSVRERRNSPSIVLWGVQNESALPREFTQRCVEAIRRLDPLCGRAGRPVVTCNGGSGADWNIIQNWSGTYSGYGGQLLTYQTDLAKPYQLFNGEYGAFRLAGWHSDPDEPLDEKGPWTEEHQARILYEKLMRAWSARDRVCGHSLWTFFSHQDPGRATARVDDGYREIDKVGPVNPKGLYTLAGRRVEAWYLYLAYGHHLKAGDLDGVSAKPLSWWLAEGHRLAGAEAIPAPRLQAKEGLVYIHRLNCGGDRTTDSAGNVWTADDTRYVHSWSQDEDLTAGGLKLNPVLGSQGVVEGGVANAEPRDQDLLGTYRYGRGRLRFEFPAPPEADCTVEMYFTEPGSYGRRFDIAINGRTVERGFDLPSVAPDRNAVRRAWTVRTGAEGRIVITFPRVAVNQAVVSAIAVATDPQNAARLEKETRKPGYPESAGLTWKELGARVRHRMPEEEKPKGGRRYTSVPPVLALPFEDRNGYHRALLHPPVSGDYSIRFKVLGGDPVGKRVRWKLETETWNDDTPSVTFKEGVCAITASMVNGAFVDMPLSTYLNAGGVFFCYRTDDDCLSAREMR